jgi:hypothetical protein
MSYAQTVSKISSVPQSPNQTSESVLFLIEHEASDKSGMRRAKLSGRAHLKKKISRFQRGYVEEEEKRNQLIRLTF